MSINIRRIMKKAVLCWLGDRSVTVYVTVLATLTVLVIAAVLVRP